MTDEELQMLDEYADVCVGLLNSAGQLHIDPAIIKSLRDRQEAIEAHFDHKDRDIYFSPKTRRSFIKSL